MLSQSRLLAITGVLLFSLCIALAASAAYADPPGRVARLEHTQGAVSYSPAGEDVWLSVVRNRPLIRGDRLWTDRDARAGFQVGSAAIRLGSNTSVEILELNDRIAQVQLSQGTLNLNVRRIHSGQTYEVATPTLAFTINRAGRYRIDVDPRSAATTIVVWKGAGEAYGENSSFPLRAGDTVRFYDTDLRDYEMFGLPREDDFDRYCLERDRRLDRSASLRYVEDDVVGYADLDEYGSWRPVSNYGNVWFPSKVEADWAPYRDGHWVWQEPWGWTWVDDAPWGFAPSHYGRWANVSNRWGWIPGPRNVRPVYAPALVAFVGGSGWSASISLGRESPVGWFPLGPREVYVPSYQASRDYFKRVNVNNTVVNNTTITNVYNNYSSGNINVKQANYANRTVPGAVTAVPRNVFVNAQPVRQSALRLDRKAGTTGEIMRVAPIAPSVRSVIGSGKAVEARPSRETIERRVFVRNAPPPGERPFAAREQQLQKNPGRAPEPSAVKSAPSSDKSAQKVRVIGEQRGAVDARAAWSRRAGGKPGAPSVPPAQLRPLDRSIQPATESKPLTGGSLDKALNGQSDAQQQTQRQQKAASEQKAAEQQKAERQRKADTDQQAAKQQQVERQRQADTQQQTQRQQKAVSEQKAAEQQQVERQRKADIEHQAAKQQQAERQRQVETQQQMQRQQKAAEQQKVERQRKIDTEQQAAKQQQAERQRQADSQQQVQRQQKAAEQRKAERQRQVDAKQQEQRQPKDAKQKQTERQRQAECERLAIEQHKDVGQCQTETQPKKPPDNPDAEKKGK